MTLRTATLNGRPPRNFKQDPRTTVAQDLIEIGKGVSYAKTFVKRPYFIDLDAQAGKELGEELLHWSETEVATTIDDFFALKRLSPSTLYRAMEENKYLSACFEIALSNIASKLNKKLQDNQLHQMHSFKMHAALPREEARMKREADAQQKVVTTYKIEELLIPSFGKDNK